MRSGIVRSSITTRQAYNNAITPTLVDYGDTDYTVMLYCPAFTAYNGPGGGDLIPVNTKIGGLTIRQTNDPNSDIVQWTNFYTISRGAYSMAACYGS